MADRTIHQLYCTHCTYGTSALHRHTGNVKDQPFEYSTRAGSIDQSTSHQKFQQFEKLIFRGLPLPSDAPADVRRQLSGTTSPWRRLVISGTPGGSVVAHVTYRTTDTSKPPRTGSYFAHILVQETSESSERRWSLADALQMWGSEFWVVQDRDDLPFDLREVSDFKRLPDFGKVINDDALISFLSTPSDGEFHDGSASPMRHELSPSCAIPERWRRCSAGDRRAFFTLLFHNVLKLNLERRERLMLAIEPSVAALLFYGVIRLLPRSGLVDQLSISTFEPHNESSSFVLTATDFYDPTTSELPLTTSRAGITINSYSGKPTLQDPISPYVKTVLDLLLDPRQGPASVDRKRNEFGQFAASGLVTIRDIEQFLSAPDLAERFVQFAPSNPVSERDVAGLTQPAARQKFRELVFSRLNSFSEDNQFWRGLRDSPARTALVMRVIREEPAIEDPSRILEQLCDCIPTRDLPQFVEDRQIPSDLRLERLRREVVSTGQLPAGCEFLWSQKSAEPNEVPLLERMFRELDFLVLESLCRSVFNEAVAKREVTSKRVLAMISFLAKAARNGDSRKTRFLTQILSDAAFGDDEWDVLLRNPEYRDQLFEVFPVDDRFLRERLIAILKELPNSGSRFLMRIDILKSGQSRLPPDRREQLANWVNVQSQLELLKEIQSTPPGLVERIFPGPRNRKLEEIGNKLGRDSKTVFIDHLGCLTADERLNTLQPLAAACLNSGQLPNAFVQGLRVAFRDLEKAKPTKKRRSNLSLASKAMSYLPYIAVGTLIVLVLGWGYRNREQFVTTVQTTNDSKNGGKPVEVPRKMIPVGTDSRNARPASKPRSADSEVTTSVAESGSSKELVKADQQPSTIQNSDNSNESTTSEPSPTTNAAPETNSNLLAVKAPDESTSSEIRARAWKIDSLYFAERSGPERFTDRYDWVPKHPVVFLTLHGPQLFHQGENISSYSDTKTWPLIVDWLDDFSLIVSTLAPKEGGAAPSNTIVKISAIKLSDLKDSVVAISLLNKPELANLELCKDRLNESWRNCVLGIHFKNEKPNFFSFDHGHVTRTGPKAAESKRFTFQLVDSAVATRERLTWAIGGGSMVNLDDKHQIPIGDGDSKSLYAGEWPLVGWPQNHLAPDATILCKNGGVSVFLTKRQLLKKVTNSDDIETVELSNSPRLNDTDSIHTFFVDNARFLSQLITTCERELKGGKKETQENDPFAEPNATSTKVKLKRLAAGRTLCAYFKLKLPEPAKKPAEIEFKNRDEFEKALAKWVDEQMVDVTNNLKTVSLAQERDEVSAIRNSIQKTSFYGHIFRVLCDEDTARNRNARSGGPESLKNGKLAAGIALLVAESKRLVGEGEKQP